MPVIFASPAATGKTTHKQKLMQHFGCSRVYDDAELHEARGKEFPQDSLLLCQSISDHRGLRGRLLSRAEMNAAMVAVGGKAIWDESGKVLHA